MNLIQGKLVSKAESLDILENIENAIVKTIAKGNLQTEDVISACDQLSKKLSEEIYLPFLMELGIRRETAENQLRQVRVMLSRKYLEEKVKVELANGLYHSTERMPMDCRRIVCQRMEPLGVLLHIAASNAEGLPVFSVIEGLLAGNINILKLPGVDDGISVKLLQELIIINPVLADYIYVFDYSSEELEMMKKMAVVADAIVVWGSDETISAVRRMAGADTKIIEWGHKLSFAYVTKDGMQTEYLRNLAQHICITNQLLCNSCQGIYLDTEDKDVMDSFCIRFLEIFEEEHKKYPSPLTLSQQAKIALHLRNSELNAINGGKQVYRGDGVSLVAVEDKVLDASLMFRNCWVRTLPRKDIVTSLKPYKNHLNTVGILCKEEERAVLTDLFIKAGVVKIARGDSMSDNYCGAPHDGAYALRCYSKIVTIES